MKRKKSKSREIEVEMNLTETSDVIVFEYKYSVDIFNLVYYKLKDKVVLLKNSKPTDLRSLLKGEREMYDAVVEFAVQYRHEFDSDYLKN